MGLNIPSSRTSKSKCLMKS